MLFLWLCRHSYWFGAVGLLFVPGAFVGADGMTTLFEAPAPGAGCSPAGFEAAGSLFAPGCWPQPARVINASADKAKSGFLIFMRSSLVVVDETAAIKGRLASTVFLLFEYFANCLIATSIGERVANRTLMRIVVGEASGLPFECAQPNSLCFALGLRHSFIDFSCSAILFFISETTLAQSVPPLEVFPADEIFTVFRLLVERLALRVTTCFPMLAILWPLGTIKAHSGAGPFVQIVVDGMTFLPLMVCLWR
jgi:hypothetical protein